MVDVRSSEGFTLVEVMTAVLIFSIGMLGVATMLTTSISSDSYNSDVRGAESLAKSKLEELRARSAAACIAPLYPATDTVQQDDPLEQRKYCRQWRIKPIDCTPCTDRYQCRITTECVYPISEVSVIVGWSRGGAGGACVKEDPSKCRHWLRLQSEIMQRPCPNCN